MSRRLASLCHWGPFTAEVAAGRLVQARPWPGSGGDPRMIGALPAMVHAPNRIDRPHVREGYLQAPMRPSGAARGRERMVPVDWETALDLVAEALASTRSRYGGEAIYGGSYGWASAGRFHHARSQLRRFLAAAGGFTDSVGNYSWGAAQSFLPFVLGDHTSVSSLATPWSSLVDDGELVLAFGGLNPKNWRVTSGGAGRHDLPDWTRQAKAAGLRFVVVSPIADDAPAWLDAALIQPRPNSDTAILLGLCYEVIVRGRADQAFLARYTVGAERFLAYVEGQADGTPKTLAWAARLADVPLAQLEALADRVIAARRVFVTAAWSLQRAEHGEMPYWATIALACLLGQVGLPGGGFGFGYGSMNAVGQRARRGFVPASPSLENPCRSAIPVARLVDMLERPGTSLPFAGGEVTLPHCRLIYWAGGNPFHHVQDVNRAARAWARPETVIVHEPWWTPTAKRADIVLPATSFAERNDIGGNGRDPFVFAMPQLIPPLAQARDDWAIFNELAERLGCAASFAADRSEATWLRRLWSETAARAQAEGLEAPDFDAFWAAGHWRVPEPDRDQVLLAGFRADPAGAPLATPSGRIELWSERIAALGLADCPPHPAWLPPREWLGADDAPAGALHLVTRQPPYRLHSQLAQTASGHETTPEPVHLNPADARARGIGEGQVVELVNVRGRCLATARLDAGVRPGALVMATGAWWSPDPALPERDLAGNPNVLTQDVATSALTQATAALSALVQVRARRVTAPPPTAMVEPASEGCDGPWPAA
ncbi:MAG: Asp-tRNA(Asn)/Glu-tRNA(Gln) amidotransferase GatCAB subunit C [Geminicoccaceae bacterium]|nr:MAG: Asp-tRNA(Asn)/Glu-tRNA(Gln) amidotransferase GatCAB subunit C [Geminicoccaceae bacterium]